MTVASSPTIFSSPTLSPAPLPTLRIGQRELSPDQVFRYLSTSKLLPQLVRDIVLEDALQTIPYSQDELQNVGQSLAQKSQYRHLDWESLRIVALRYLRLTKFKEISWGNSLESYFLKRRPDLDQVVCSIIQTADASLAQELYFRLQNQEASFEELARQYSQSSEAGDGGVLGPIALNKLHPEIAKHLRGLQAGEMAPVFILGNQCILIRLDQVLPAHLDEATRQKLMDELFENWLERETAKELGTTLPDLLHATQLASDSPRLEPLDEIDAQELQPWELEALRVQSPVSTMTAPGITPPPSPHHANPSLPPLASPLSPTATSATRAKRSTKAPHRQPSQWSLAASVLGGLLMASGVGGTYWLLQDGGADASPSAEITSVVRSEEDTKSDLKVKLIQPAFDQAITAATLTQIAQTSGEWTQVITHWQGAIDLLNQVPSHAAEFALAQEKVTLYQQNLAYAQQRQATTQDAFHQGVRAATLAAQAVQGAKTVADWEAAGVAWKQAIESMMAVPQNHDRYAIAQQRIPIYEANWDYTQYRIANP